MEPVGTEKPFDKKSPQMVLIVMRFIDWQE